jgi:mannose-6-phosphate isomerase-like protein (cupin superfamily)
MARRYTVGRREALEVTETPYGSVGVLHAGAELRAWWIWKEHEELDPEWTVLTREDFLFVVRGALRIELRDGDSLVLEAGDSFVIPAGTAFRGYRWPRDADEPCVFLAVSAADVETAKAPVI